MMTTEIAKQQTMPGMPLGRPRPKMGQNSRIPGSDASQTRSHTALVPQKGLPVGASWKVGADACNVILFRKVKTTTARLTGGRLSGTTPLSAMP